MEYKKKIESLGYTSKQSSLYLAGLSLGNAPASRYASHTGINRATAYQELLTMEGLGLVKKSKHLGVWMFEPLSPKILLGTHTSALQHFQQIVPDLEALTHSFPSSEIHSYKGITGLQEAFETILGLGNNDHPYLCLIGTQNIHPDFKKFLGSDHRVSLRKQNPIQSRCILNPSMHLYNKHIRKSFEYKITDSSYFQFPGEIATISDHSVGFLLYGTQDIEAIIIKHPSLNAMVRAVFMTLWECL